MPAIVDIQHQHTAGIVPSNAQVIEWVNAAIETPERTLEVSVRFVDEEEGRELNATYRQKDNVTNVLSFPFECPDELKDEITLLGDIVLCVPVVIQEAKEQNKTLLAHWAHLLIHGTLHLQGYDHIEAADATVMEAREIELLHPLGFSNPYLSTTT